MRLSKLCPSDQKLIVKGLKSKDAFVRGVAESCDKSDTMTDKQRTVLVGSPTPFSVYDEWDPDDVEYNMEQNDLMDIDPWGD